MALRWALSRVPLVSACDQPLGRGQQATASVDLRLIMPETYPALHIIAVYMYYHSLPQSAVHTWEEIVQEDGGARAARLEETIVNVRGGAAWEADDEDGAWRRGRRPRHEHMAE